MTLEKAIEILDDRLTQGIAAEGDDFLNALKLGIGSLKRLWELRRVGVSHPWPLLPGETTQ
ncbi:hypothetical protein ES703_100580 [subsurface metagenome]